jgi:predicted cupin superfamily sugar epimerase
MRTTTTLLFVTALFACSDSLCTDTRCAGAAKECCEGSPALQKKDMCVGSADCDACCGWVSSTIPFTAQRWIDALSLEKQVFGNFLGITYSSKYEVEQLPSNFKGGKRMLNGEIYNLFTINRSDTTQAQGGFPLHMLEGDETYHYYTGDGPLTLFEFDLDSRTVKNISIGSTTPGCDVPQHTILGRTWTGALLSEGTTWTLTGAGTTPGFDPRDSHMLADDAAMMVEFHNLFPNHTGLIKRLTSF